MPHPETHVIIGAGLAGAKTAETLRDEGFEGRIVLLGAEAELPYERPPLSKGYLRGESPRQKARVHADGYYDAHDIELRTSTSVASVDLGMRHVVLADGERVRFDQLVFATGAEPRRLSLPGSELAGVHYLRDFADADALRRTFAAGGHLVVIGGGWIGMEVAASARQLGLDVTVVEPHDVPLGHALGARLGAFYADVHRDNGVQVLTGAAPARLDGADSVERVVLVDGRVLECSAVVIGVGVVPRTALAEQAGLVVENGIVATKRLETSAPTIFAVGDVASAFHPFYGRRMRVEHWANALNQPAVAACAMLGKPASYERHPYFFSDQYDVGMEFTGDPAGSDQLVLRGDVASREFIAFWLAGGRVVAGMNVNVWDVVDEIKALISSRALVDPRRLANPDAALADLVEAPAVTK